MNSLPHITAVTLFPADHEVEADDEFSAWLVDHFRNTDESRREELLCRAHRQAEAEALRKQFTAVADGVIRPVFNQAAIALLAREFPAMVTTEPSSGREKWSAHGYIGLHCTDEPTREAEVKLKPSFLISFSGCPGGRVRLESTRTRSERVGVRRDLHLAEVTHAKVVGSVKDFIAGAFLA